MEVRKANPQDLEKLKEIGKQTFKETFSLENGEDNMKEYLESGFSTEKIKAELNDPNSEFYMAEVAGKTVGYLKVNVGQSQTELKDEKGIEIERIYVLKEHHGRGVGQILYKKALEVAEGKGLEYVWLGVWERNFRAIRFYEKNGFEAFDKHIFKLGSDEQTDIMMKLKLIK